MSFHDKQTVNDANLLISLDEWVMPDFPAFVGKAPDLRHVTLKGLRAPWRDGSYRNLPTLQILGCSLESHPLDEYIVAAAYPAVRVILLPRLYAENPNIKHFNATVLVKLGPKRDPRNTCYTIEGADGDYRETPEDCGTGLCDDIGVGPWCV